MSDRKLEPVGDLYGYGDPDNANAFTLYPDQPLKTVLIIGFDLFLIFAVVFTVITGGKRLAAFVNQKFTHRRSRQRKRSASRMQASTDVAMEPASPPTAVATTTHDAPRS